ncbi:MAG TPA: hypothetical protein VNA32_03890 [Actinomycetota bacterium]|nr:hypothetical protein [Actinomycetota bacterium]
MGSTSRDDPDARRDASARTPSRSFVPGAREAIIVAIFVLAGIFEVLSGDPVAHGAVLFAVGGLLSWDAVHRRHQEPDPSPAEPSVEPLVRPRVTPVVVFAWLAYAALVGTFGRYTWPSTVSVVGPGAAGVVVAWRRPTYQATEPLGVDPWGTVSWVAVFLALALWELAALLLQPSLTTPSAAHPTISTLTDPVLASHLGRSITLSLWLVFGWLLLQR